MRHAAGIAVAAGHWTGQNGPTILAVPVTTLARLWRGNRRAGMPTRWRDAGGSHATVDAKSPP
jgi:hypothetical protein